MDTLTLPSARDEAWRWSDMATLEAAREIKRVAGHVGSTARIGDGPRLVFIDGYYDPDFSEPGDLTLERVEFTSTHPLGQFAAGQGYELRFPPASFTAPIEIEHVVVGEESHLPLRFVLDDDAVVSVVETYSGGGWSNRLSEFSLGKGARLMRAVRLLQDEGFVSIRDEASIGEAASYVATFLGAGGMGSRIDGFLRLDGVGAFAEMGGALLTRGEQKQEAAVAVHHAAIEGTSRQVWRAVAADASTASLAARAEVARHAQKTDGEQSLRGLLLKRTATINLKPELEIFADDVKCAHGATVGELDAKALFYMQSRGIPEPQAKALLTHAFVADALDRIGEESVRDAFKADADAWLEAAL
ncbi:SufD family Fe-S cluster assembly protein [Sphingomonas sp. MG17]|uniref:SufD family Fe-S cluster assembly protein n=1 Tax=Sphingomonas tagetis TaxID=2949092 RepID=A0A9X2HNE8_9SPHN|nr:SufD family Fe-S cluster assembly protein [Sphingomonas tagetis]MCP3729575.1 SufD family Fe-S cluster assembly protein [Sphingomonas tagetis]